MFDPVCAISGDWLFVGLFALLALASFALVARDCLTGRREEAEAFWQEAEATAEAEMRRAA